jgi:hypothetical protein
MSLDHKSYIVEKLAQILDNTKIYYFVNEPADNINKYIVSCFKRHAREDLYRITKKLDLNRWIAIVDYVLYLIPTQTLSFQF